jgi:tetratricopeptide (TPR) repeat protein
LLRFEQDRSEGAQHDAVCARHRALAEARLDQPDLQYLNIRCMGNEVQKNEQFVLAQQKWPDNAWLSLAAGATHAEHGDYQKAEPLYELARKRLPAMHEYLTLDTARLRRLNAGESEPRLNDLMPSSEHLSMLVSIENGTGLDATPLAPYALLARGNLDAAASAAKKLGDGHERVLQLVASSDGATHQMMQEALALPLDASDDFNTAIAMYAVAVRINQDPSPYSAQIERLLGPASRPTLEFLESVRHGKNPSQALANLPALDFRLRMHAQHAAVIMLAQRAPAQWRADASRGLFVGERGYLRPH